MVTWQRPSFLTGIFLLFIFSGCDLFKNTTKAIKPAGGNQAILSDEALLTLVQKQTFQYFWEGAEPTSGMARERFHADDIYPEKDKNIVTIGGTGFGVMALLVGMERHFITRSEGINRFNQIVTNLEKADRFHGMWPHWLYGETGKVKPFSPKDDGGDMVESAFLAQGLLCARQYFNKGNTQEKQLAARIDKLWRGMEWDWYRKNKENALYWHWSPTQGWAMNFKLEGYNECLIAYVLAAASPTHGVPAEVYHQGWARNGGIKGNTQKYGYTLSLKHNGSEEYGGPLFWAHYSYLGLYPRNLKDRYADYGEHNKNQTLINYQYCVENPKNFKGYGPDSWGLTASYSVNFYDAHQPSNDKGVISPTAALSSFPYTPNQSMRAMRYFYEKLGDKLWGKYGFYDAFSETENWYPQKYLAIDQGPIIVMMENYRTGLLWNLFMSCPEVQNGLDKLGFTYRKP